MPQRRRSNGQFDHDTSGATRIPSASTVPAAEAAQTDPSSYPPVIDYLAIIAEADQNRGLPSVAPFLLSSLPLSHTPPHDQVKYAGEYPASGWVGADEATRRRDVEWFAEENGVEAREVTIVQTREGVLLQCYRPLTEAELQEQADAAAATAERQRVRAERVEAEERAELVRLLEKYGNPGESA